MRLREMLGVQRKRRVMMAGEVQRALQRRQEVAGFQKQAQVAGWGGEAVRWVRQGWMRSRAVQQCRAGLDVITGKPHLHAIGNGSVSSTFL